MKYIFALQLNYSISSRRTRPTLHFHFHSQSISGSICLSGRSRRGHQGVTFKHPFTHFPYWCGAHSSVLFFKCLALSIKNVIGFLYGSHAWTMFRVFPPTTESTYISIKGVTRGNGRVDTNFRIFYDSIRIDKPFRFQLFRFALLSPAKFFMITKFISVPSKMNEMVSKGVEYFSETSLHYGPSKLEKHCEEWGKDAIISYANASWPKGTIKCPTES